MPGDAYFYEAWFVFVAPCIPLRCAGVLRGDPELAMLYQAKTNCSPHLHTPRHEHTGRTTRAQFSPLRRSRREREVLMGLDDEWRRQTGEHAVMSPDAKKSCEHATRAGVTKFVFCGQQTKHETSTQPPIPGFLPIGSY